MSLRSSTLAALRTGRVTIKSAGNIINDTPGFIIATVASAREERRVPYGVTRTSNGVWSCTCARGDTGEGCAHVAAVALVTGHPSAAALERAA